VRIRETKKKQKSGTIIPRKCHCLSIDQLSEEGLWLTRESHLEILDQHRQCQFEQTISLADHFLQPISI
jgi:hypothetical protein